MSFTILLTDYYGRIQIPSLPGLITDSDLHDYVDKVEDEETTPTPRLSKDAAKPKIRQKLKDFKEARSKQN